MERFSDLDAGSLRDILSNGEAEHLSSAARERCRMLLFAAEKKEEGTSVEVIIEDIREQFGASETTVRRWLRRFDPNNPFSLEERSRAPQTVRQPETDDRVVALIEQYREGLANNGPRSIRRALKVEHGIEVSASTVWRVLKRNVEKSEIRNSKHEINPKHEIQNENDRGETSEGNGTSGTLAAALLLAVTAALSFGVPPVEASGTSDSFKIDFDSIQTGTEQGDSDSFTVIGGTTNILKAGESESFSLSPDAFITAEEESEEPAQDTTEETPVAQESGGSRGSAENMAQTIREAYESFLQERGLPPPEADGEEVGESASVSTESPVIRSYRERLLATVDDRRVIYRDVTTDKWYTPYISFVVGEGIAHGYETDGGWLTGVFGVSNPVTKAEALKMTLLATGKDVPAGGEPLNRSAQGTWAQAYVRTAEELQLRGYSRDENVHEPQTRAGVVRTIMEVIGLPLAKKPAPFGDIPKDHPDSGAIVTAAFYDLIEGFPDGTFRPQELMNRASVAKVMTMVRRMLMP